MPAVSAAPGHNGRFGGKPDAGLQPLWNFVGEPVEIFFKRYGATVRQPRIARGSHSARSRPARALETIIADWDWCAPTDAVRFAGLLRASSPAPRGNLTGGVREQRRARSRGWPRHRGGDAGGAVDFGADAPGGGCGEGGKVGARLSARRRGGGPKRIWARLRRLAAARSRGRAWSRRPRFPSARGRAGGSGIRSGCCSGGPPDPARSDSRSV
jgi:hypothetical protein